MGTRSRHGIEHAHVDDKLHEHTVHTARAHRRAQRGHPEPWPELRAQRGHVRGRAGDAGRTWCMTIKSCACAHTRQRAAARPPPTGAARRPPPQGDGRDHQRLCRLRDARAGYAPTAAQHPSPGPPRRIPPPSTMGAPETPPRPAAHRRTRTQPTTKRTATETATARTRPRAPRPPRPPHRPTNCRRPRARRT